MEKNYNPKKIEEKWLNYWIENKIFHADENSDKKPFTIVIPPPNVTGILHIGHALNNTIQDIIIRTKRMQGYEALWIPGTDHAGIATQNVVEKKLAKEGKTRHDLGREDFIDEVWEWKEKHGSYIIDQLKKIGASCDWDRERFTMDEGLSDAVKDSFIDLFNKGLIYRGKYIVNHCPRCQTALADDEVEYADDNGHFWHIKYQIEGSDEFIQIATTRPETLLGDTAVAVNPKDERYKELVGKNVILPIVNKAIPIIADDYVDIEFGTGIVKITPAHDPNDFLVGERHNLEKINILTEDGKINENAPKKYQGLDRFDARKLIVEDLEKSGNLVKIEEHVHSVGHCYRCDTVIEPYYSDQWFVKMKPLAQKAINAVDTDAISFVPKRWTKVYLNWMNNIRDWCISRQIWWGHRVPIYYNAETKEYVAAKSMEDAKEKLGTDNVYQDSDVLDTWFSSWLWPFSTMGWPKETEALKKFYPTNVLVTAQDIIFFWVARMVMAGIEFKGEVPFKDIFIHGVVRDDKGRKMSKSLGNSIDPLEIVSEFGADALRFSIILLAPAGQDVYLSKEKFNTGRNFANKIWNATRFLLTKSNDFKYNGESPKNINLIDKAMLSKLSKIISDITESIENYRLNDAASMIYDFFWHTFCGWYIELKKVDLNESSNEDDFIVIYYILDKLLRLLHPFMPFISEELFSIINKGDQILSKAKWPESVDEHNNIESEEFFDRLTDIITAIRNIRAEKNIAISKKIKVSINVQKEEFKDLLLSNRKYFIKIAKLDELNVGIDLAKPEESVASVVKGNEVFVHLDGLIDIEAEKLKFKKEIERFERLIKASESKLNNKNFVDRAPKKVVDIEKEKLGNFKKQLELLNENITKLGADK